MDDFLDGIRRRGEGKAVVMMMMMVLVEVEVGYTGRESIHTE